MASTTHAEIEELSAPTGSVVYQAIQHEGEQELERATAALAWSGLAAGLSMKRCSAPASPTRNGGRSSRS